MQVTSRSRPQSLVMGWLMTFEAATANAMVLDNATGCLKVYCHCGVQEYLV
ncbi:hypothetical protein [uncultured Thermosynechococcus sp.]|uniref:hypothetical protein n=1 Tax=uncultured Thermosynechococcus sp. TaxID=436945 RepID=UPI0026202FC9|nr:hypothetical protein [uncultured Thermosynechococcus sp.]